MKFNSSLVECYMYKNKDKKSLFLYRSNLLSKQHGIKLMIRILFYKTNEIRSLIYQSKANHLINSQLRYHCLYSRLNPTKRLLYF